MSSYSIVPRHVSYLSSKCSCDASVPLEFFSWLNKTKSIILIDNHRATLLEKYILVRFNKQMRLVDIPIVNDLFEKEIWNDLKAKKVVFY
jgi:hypothetical protein